MSSERKWLKLILVGPAGVGKTCLDNRAKGKIVDRDDQYNSTIGVDFRHMSVNGYDVQIWDTAGMEQHGNFLTDSYYRNAKVIFLVYDVCRHDSLDDIQRWMGYAYDVIGEELKQLVIYWIGNKVDSNKRCISLAQVQDLTPLYEGYDIHLVEASAFRDESHILDGQNRVMLHIRDMFEIGIMDWISKPKVEVKRQTSTIQIVDDPAPNERKCCCN